MSRIPSQSIGDFVRNFVVKPSVVTLALVTASGYVEAQQTKSKEVPAPKYDRRVELCNLNDLGMSRSTIITHSRVVDVNGDGKPDIILTTRDGYVYVCINRSEYEPKK